MYYIGYDIGSSSIKIALVDSKTGKNLAVLNEPKAEMEIISQKKDWAEQHPDTWWRHICKGTKRILEETKTDNTNIIGIGISYQMHGLVAVDENGIAVRNSIIWCDSRAVSIGENAFNHLGEKKCTAHLLNSPGNFTASKLKWVSDNEPEVYQKIHKYMLPGDYIAYKLTGIINTTKNGLSEGILWDYKNNSTADFLLEYYNIQKVLTPSIVENFTIQSKVNEKGAMESGLFEGTPIFYRAGDQPNNALSLNVLKDGEIAATGGTSGVIYAVTHSLQSKESTRINQFAHVNYTNEQPTLGKLLCINGAGIQYRWLKDNFIATDYNEMNQKASAVPIGSEGLYIIPFGNGAERMFNNKNIGAHFCNLNLNKHTDAHIYRATLEGIAFAFMYGMEILKNDNATIDVIRAGNDNLFRSDIFSNTVATLIGHEIEIYNTTGAIGAARACSLIDGDYKKFGDIIMKNDHVMTYTPLKEVTPYREAYENWKKALEKFINHE